MRHIIQAPYIKPQPLWFLLLACCLLFACRNKASMVPVAETGLTIKEALGSFELEPGFKIEILAAEPLIADPVDMEID